MADCSSRPSRCKLRLVRLFVAARQFDSNPVPETRSGIDKQAVCSAKPTAPSRLRFSTRTAEQVLISPLGPAGTSAAICFPFAGVVQHSASGKSAVVLVLTMSCDGDTDTRAETST